jgi:hypothetical protein
MRNRRLWPIVTAGLLLAASGPPAPAAPAAAPPAGPPPAEPGPAPTPGAPVVTLLEAGAEPRRPLRLRPRIGDVQEIELTVRLEMEQSVDGRVMPSQKAPGMRYTMETTVKAPDDAGDITYAFEFRNAAVIDEAGVHPVLVDMMRTALQALEGLRGVGVMTDRGFSKLVRFERPPDMDPGLVEQLEAMERSMGQLVPPLPNEPVGVGAAWKVERSVPHQGMLIRQTDLVNLVAADDDRIEIRTDLRQRADPQKLEAPGMPPMNLLSLEAKGTTTAVLRPGRLFPETSTTDLTNDTEILLEQFGAQQQLHQHTELRSEMKTK